MNNREIRKKSKYIVRHRIWYSIIICFLVLFVSTFGYRFNTASHIIKSGVLNGIVDNASHYSNLDIFLNYLKNAGAYNLVDTINNYHSTRGVLSAFFNQITGSGSIIYGILNVFNQYIFDSSIPNLLLTLLGFIIFLFVYTFIGNLLVVGRCRYFLEHNSYNNTGLDKVLFVYKYKKIWNVWYIMLEKTLHSLLWYFTIIGGIIKHYEYSMIPYILAENPTLSNDQVFKLTKELTKGHKMEMFRLDLSLIMWYILGICTLGISNLFYFYPYRETIKGFIYRDLRNNIYNSNKEYFKDSYLFVDFNNESYPVKEYFMDVPDSKFKYKLNYNIKYNLLDYVLFFMTFSIIGWLWEGLLSLYTNGIFLNRGTMHGPWIPIYGWGGVLILYLLKNFRGKPQKIFLYSFILCGVLEYCTAWYLETFKGLKWWDYSGYFLNIDGRICLEGLLVFGLGGCIFTYFLAPILYSIYKKINVKILIVISSIFIILFGIDMRYSSIKPNEGLGITTISIYDN